LIGTPFKWALPATSAAVAIVLLVAGVFANATPPEKSSSRIYYTLNADTGKAMWASDLAQPDERAAQFFGTSEKGSLMDFAYNRKSREYTTSAAPATPAPAPELTVVEDKNVAGVRSLKLRISSPRQAGMVFVYLDSSAEVLSSSIDKTLISEEPRTDWGVQIDGFPEQGIELQLQVKATQQLRFRIIDQSYGLPAVNGVANQSPLTDTPDLTLLVKSFAL
jgi:hypothetical protein